MLAFLADLQASLEKIKKIKHYKESTDFAHFHQFCNTIVELVAMFLGLS